MLGCRKVLVLAGCMAPNDALNKAIVRLAENGNVAVLAEPLSNLSTGTGNIEASLCCLGKEGRDEMVPDLLITIGGAIVSGPVKKWLRESAPAEHWHVAEGDGTTDTFMHLTERIDMKPEDFFRETAGAMRRGVKYGGEGSDYGERWRKVSDEAYKALDELTEWSDMAAMNVIVEMLPARANVQLSNGMTVRYYEWVSRRRAHRADCNRGVSGIDGSTSTAIGASIAYNGLTVLLTGDMSAQYDIGALTSVRAAGDRLKMAVFANGGGNIFKYIKNTRDTAETGEFLYNKVDTDWRKTGEAYGMAVYEAHDMASLNREAAKWLGETGRSAMLVVHTDADTNAQVMRAIIKKV